MRATSLLLTSILSTTLLLSACSSADPKAPTKAELVETHSKALNDWFQARFEDGLARSPMTQTYFGEKENQGQLDDVSQMAEDETAALTKSWLEEMRREFDIDRLDPQTALSYRLYEFDAEDQLASYKFSGNDYVFQHMSGPHSGLPSFMINFHSVASAEDVQAYISRLNGFKTYLGQYAQRADAQFDNGVILPKFVYAKLSEASRNVITGAPFTEEKDSPIFADIKAKIENLDIPQDQKNSLLDEAKAALLGSVQPAYISLLEMFKRHEDGATKDDGAWKLPEAENYYAARLRHYTTTDMSADEIHEIGLKEVTRIQGEMREIMKQVIVKRVEPFREATAFGAFYDQPAIDGSRPGTYYINLKDVTEQPKYLMQALAYHEGIPGHHMQIAIGMELEGLPKFRTLGGHTSYIEGWALYSESVPKELGLYTDPYKDFGRLSMEIFRAARLVVDTGIHTKKWTREQAVQYYLDNIPNPEGDVRAEIDRYIVWPGQATAYKIGMIKIQDLRKDAETRLGEKFDIREFHDVVLANGSVPLKVLEELVNDWVKSKG